MINTYKNLCLYAFCQGINLRLQTPGTAVHSRTLFDCGFLYLPAIVKADPEYLNVITALDIPDDITTALGSRFPQFDAKAHLAAKAETKRLADKAAKKK